MVVKARALVQILHDESLKRRDAAEDLRIAVAASRTSLDDDSLRASLAHALEVGISDDNNDVVTAKDLLDTIEKLKYKAAVHIQKHVRKILCMKHAEKLQKERDEEIFNIFGELGNAFMRQTEEQFQHTEATSNSSFLTDFARLKHIYEDEDKLKKANDVITRVQANVRRYLDRRSYQYLLSNEMKRVDTDGGSYTKAEFVEHYGREDEWNAALLVTHRVESLSFEKNAQTNDHQRVVVSQRQHAAVVPSSTGLRGSDESI